VGDGRSHVMPLTWLLVSAVDAAAPASWLVQLQCCNLQLFSKGHFEKQNCVSRTKFDKSRTSVFCSSLPVKILTTAGAVIKVTQLKYRPIIVHPSRLSLSLFTPLCPVSSKAIRSRENEDLDFLQRICVMFSTVAHSGRREWAAAQYEVSDVA